MEPQVPEQIVAPDQTRRRLTLVASVVWVVLVGASLAWNWWRVGETTSALAVAAARESFEKDLVYRRWVALQGGVYVAPSEKLPPNPYLAHIPDRDVTTTSGRNLTLVNPAYMTRQVHELGRERYGARGHITSLEPIRPENAADAWETGALRAFEAGAREVSSVELLAGEPFLRLIRPLVTEAACLRCHAEQGYRVGDVRGGISVSVPLAPYSAAARESQWPLAIGHLLIGLLGLGGMALGSRLLGASETALQESARLHCALVEGIPDVVIRCDRGGRHLFVSRNARDLFDLEAAGMLGKTPRELGLSEPLCRFWEDAIGKALLGGTPLEAEISFEAKRGPTTVNWRLVPELDARGSTRSVLCLGRDVTERRQAEAERERLELALRQAADEWTRTFDALESPILILDAERRVLRLNRAAAAAAEIEVSSGPGRSVGELGPGELWQSAAELALPAGGEQASLRRVHDPISGRHWELATNRIESGSDTGGVILLARDVTSVVQLEEAVRQSKLLAAMGSLTAGVAHEVRNPLFAIAANVDALEVVLASHTEVADLIDAVRSEVARLARLMQQLLDYGKPAPVALADENIWHTLDAAIEACEPLARNKGVGLTTQGRSGARLTVRMDRDRMAQVLGNLIENAIQHSPAGERVKVDVARVEMDGRAWVRCAITDSGPGFRAEDAGRLFEPFFSRRRGGTGLGLSIAQRIVDQHAGRLRAENGPRGGALLIVELPLAGQSGQAPPRA